MWGDSVYAFALHDFNVGLYFRGSNAMSGPTKTTKGQFALELMLQETMREQDALRLLKINLNNIIERLNEWRKK